MFLLATFDKLLSTPAELYAVTAKYQVPEPRPVTIYEVSPGFASVTV